MYREILAFVTTINEPHLRALLDMFFQDGKFTDRFKHTPGSKKHHHNYIGGLLEHTINVTKLCEVISTIYPELDKDLLITSALLHDIGKLKGYSYHPEIDITTAEGLLGHLYLGIEMLNEKIDALPDFPEDLKLKLYHIVLSHHRQTDWGAFMEPCFSEANALSYADLLDSQVKNFLQLESTEREKVNNKGKTWSSYIRELRRYLYLGSKSHREP
jgi:3'-5' exoribonuclease